MESFEDLKSHGEISYQEETPDKFFIELIQKKILICVSHNIKDINSEGEVNQFVENFVEKPKDYMFKNRGLLHSFRDCRETLRSLFRDLSEMAGEGCLGWELAFELRLKRCRSVRLYADVLVITDDRVFSLEFKMKDRIDPEEVRQAAKYAPWLEVLFGPEYEIIPVLVLTAARDLYAFAPIGDRDAVLPVCSGDMLFNAFDEYLGFLG